MKTVSFRFDIDTLTCIKSGVPKLIEISKKHNIELNTIAGGWYTNLKVRPEKDWESLKGRAVSKDD